MQAVELARLFYGVPEKLAHFQAVTPDAMPAPYRQLLAHQNQMTQTIEAWHGCPVDLEVLGVRGAGPDYARQIVLHRSTDGVAVQYAILKVNLDSFDALTRGKIEAGIEPFGRILAEHPARRRIELTGLWEVVAGPALAEALGVAVGARTFGRTVAILCDDCAAVQVLEIITPLQA